VVQTRPQVLDYALISDQNIFHPERKIPPEKKEEKAIPKPDVILYGTVTADQMSVAFVEDKKAPRTTQGRGKRQIALHKGEQLSGYTLKEITANSIVLIKGEEKMVVLLEEGDKRKTVETLRRQSRHSPVRRCRPQLIHRSKQPGRKRFRYHLLSSRLCRPVSRVERVPASACLVVAMLRNCKSCRGKKRHGSKCRHSNHPNNSTHPFPDRQIGNSAIMIKFSPDGNTAGIMDKFSIIS